MRLGPYTLSSTVFVAPMAGVTDRPFRTLCRELGAGYAVSEMTASDPRLLDSVKTQKRADHRGEAEPRAVQIAGADPAMMANAARHNVERGAQIIDINMGCPARKVCNVHAGSALMADEPLATAIVAAVRAAVDVPVTVKMRTGPHPGRRNAVDLARRFEDLGVAMLTVHGRTRACGYSGQAEYETLAAIRRAVRIPLVANGDIDSPAKALAVLRHTQADALMIGRAAQGRPWIFREIAHHLATGRELPGPTRGELRVRLLAHLVEHYAFHGERTGVRTARKHVGWYLAGVAGWQALRAHFNTLERPDDQLDLIGAFLAGDAASPVSTAAPRESTSLEMA